MEFEKMMNLLNITSDNKDLPRYVTKKWIEVHNQSEKNYNHNKEIRIKTSMLRSDLCDFSDAYVVKTFNANDFVEPNNTAAIVTATNNANNNAFDKKR